MVRILQHAVLLLAVMSTALLLLAAPSTGAPARVVQTTAAQRLTAANAAVSKVRSPYRLASAGPRTFDCSGLVTFAFRRAGKPLLGRSSYDLWNMQGVRIGRAALRRGDLVWTWDRRFGHVGIFLGHGRYVHAPGRGRRVEIAPLPSGPNFIGAIRP